MNDEEIINTLNDIDNDDDIEVTDWEGEFLESVLGLDTLTKGQREKALEIIAAYT